MWQAITTAPFDRDLELLVVDEVGEHALVVPCRRTADGWINATTGKRIEVSPTHWRTCQEVATNEDRAMWQPISTAPYARDLELAVIHEDGPHALLFPCRHIGSGWIEAESKRLLQVWPTHWREWQERRRL